LSYAPSHHVLDTIGGYERILVFPHDHNLPTFGAQPTLGIGVALDGASKLRSPPGPVLLGHRPVRRAGMPVAPPNLHNDTGTSEHDIVAPARPGENRSVNPVTQAASV
jgi:hypothetical protein